MTDERSQLKDIEIGSAVQVEAFTEVGRLNGQHIRLAREPQAIDDETLERILADALRLAEGSPLARDRATAGRIARFWTAEKARRAREARPAEAGADPGAIYSTIALTPGSTQPAIAYESPPLQQPLAVDARSSAARSTALLRFRALARQWDTSGRQSGFLLKGAALAEARTYVADDADIAALVAASDSAGKKGMWIIVGLSLTIACGSIGLAWYALDQRSRALAEAASSKTDAEEAERERKELELKLAEAQARLTQLSTESVSRNDELARARNSNPLVIGQGNTPITGYRADFLVNNGICGGDRRPGGDGDATSSAGRGRPIPMPRLRPEFAPGLANNGSSIRFLNYSSLVSGAWRLPVVTGSNICRSGLQGVARADLPITQIPEVIPSGQRVQAWYDENRLAALRLVSAREIAWVAAPGSAQQSPTFGSTFPAEQTSVSANTVPASPNAIRNWDGLRRYALTEFNPVSASVTVFSGPILRNVPPTADVQTPTPKAFWIVIVGRGPGENSAPLVEAYILPDDLAAPEGLEASNPLALRLLLQATASSVEAIERETALIFPDVLRQASAAQAPQPQTERVQSNSRAADIIALVPRLDDASQQVRQSAAQSLITALRDGGLPAQNDQRLVIGALVTSLGIPSFSQLSPNARVNLAFVLSAIPQATWDQEAFRDLKARTRRGIADIETAVYGNVLPEMPTAFSHLANAKAKLGFDLALNRQVYLQFAGMTRGDAELMRSRLQALGWFLPGTERTDNANRLNEVRFAPQDDAAGRQLADDIEALGRPLGREILKRPTTRVNAGRPEIWVSAVPSPTKN